MTLRKLLTSQRIKKLKTTRGVQIQDQKKNIVHTLLIAEVDKNNKRTLSIPRITLTKEHRSNSPYIKI